MGKRRPCKKRGIKQVNMCSLLLVDPAYIPGNLICFANLPDCSGSGVQQGRNEHIPLIDGSTEGNDEESEDGEDEGHEGVHYHGRFVCVEGGCRRSLKPKGIVGW